MAAKPPKHLSPAMKKFWRRVEADYELDAADAQLFTLLCEALDRGSEARQALGRDGAYGAGRYGQVVPHPALNVERDSKTLAARLMRQLGIDEEPPPPRTPRSS